MIIGNWDIEIVRESGAFKKVPIPGSKEFKVEGFKRFNLNCKYVPTGLVIPKEVWFLKPYTETEFNSQLTEFTKLLNELVKPMEISNG